MGVGEGVGLGVEVGSDVGSAVAVGVPGAGVDVFVGAGVFVVDGAVAVGITLGVVVIWFVIDGVGVGLFIIVPLLGSRSMTKIIVSEITNRAIIVAAAAKTPFLLTTKTLLTDGICFNTFFGYDSFPGFKFLSLNIISN